MKTLAFAFIAWCALITPAFSQSTDCHTLESCQGATKADRRSSLAYYRIGEIYFQMGNASEFKVELNVLCGAFATGCENYVTAINHFMAVLGGDSQPAWTVVWAHINVIRASRAVTAATTLAQYVEGTYLVQVGGSGSRRRREQPSNGSGAT